MGSTNDERDSRRYVTLSLSRKRLKDLGQKRRKEKQFLLTDNRNGMHTNAVVSSHDIDILNVF